MKIVKNIKDNTKASMKANNKIQLSHKVYIYSNEICICNITLNKPCKWRHKYLTSHRTHIMSRDYSKSRDYPQSWLSLADCPIRVMMSEVAEFNVVLSAVILLFMSFLMASTYCLAVCPFAVKFPFRACTSCSSCKSSPAWFVIYEQRTRCFWFWKYSKSLTYVGL